MTAEKMVISKIAQRLKERSPALVMAPASSRATSTTGNSKAIPKISTRAPSSDR